MFLSIPVVHIKAGLRSNDPQMKEEINRHLIDHGSMVLFAPTETAIRNLINESVLGKIVSSGDTMYDLLLSKKAKILDKKLFDSIAMNTNITKKNYIVMTIHRRENLKNPSNIDKILSNIGQSDIITIFPIHPYTRKIIKQLNIQISDNIRLIDPLSYQEFLNLVAHSG